MPPFLDFECPVNAFISGIDSSLGLTSADTADEIVDAFVKEAVRPFDLNDVFQTKSTSRSRGCHPTFDIPLFVDDSEEENETGKQP